MEIMSSPLLINDEENNMNTFSTSDNEFEETLNEECFREANGSGSHENRQYSNPYLMRWLESKQKIEKFRFDGYVEYSKDTNLSKCLIKSCDRLLSCRNAGNIKRHYRRIHNFVILHGKLNPFTEGEEDSSNLDKYFSYDCAKNKSACKVPGCTKTFEGKYPEIMRHFRSDHNYKTDHNDWVNLCRLKFDRSKLPLNELITYDKQTCTFRCLFMNCDYILEKNFLAIEKHYHDLHVIILSKHTGNARSVPQVRNENAEISDQEEFLSDDEHSTNEPNSKQSATTLKVREKRKFFASNYVEYCKEANVSKCLIQNCGRRLKGLSTYNIQRHYQLLHNMYAIRFLKYISTLDTQNDGSKCKLSNFVSYNVGAGSYQCLFVNCNDNLEVDVNVIKSHYYEKHEIILSKRTAKTRKFKGIRTEDENEPHCSKSLIKAAKGSREIINSTGGIEENFVVTNYVDFNSKCLMRNCPALNEELKDEQTIKIHYSKVHNVHIGLNLALEEDESTSEYVERECLKINDFAYFDQEVSAYKCLFNKCNQVFENYSFNIKKHYQEKHMAVIAKSASGCRKRKYFHQRCESASSENDSLSITNEILSEDEKPLHLEKTQRFISELCTIKTEYSNETGENLGAPIKNDETRDACIATTMNCNYLKDITLTKQKFLKSCFGLIIQRDLVLNLFDDDVFFKHLLSPYEKIINFHINAKLLLDIIVKANDIIVEVLKEIFCNKILCFDMYVVRQQNKYFTTVNVRYIHEHSIRNYLIGFMPINKAGAEVLPISEYLMKFNIDKEQVYMTTILADLRDDEEIIEILNNICQHNPDIKKHPLYYMKLLYRSFVQQYSQEIQNWQNLLNNNDTEINTDVLKHLHHLQRQIENLSVATDVDIKLQLTNEPNLFLKTVKIFSNFMEKLNEEQYVAGDFYRDLLCCELELKGENKKNNNAYANKLNEDLRECKNVLMQSDEFVAALYLDSRFNFLGSRLLTDDQKTSGKLLLCSLWERYSKYLQFADRQIDPVGNNEEAKKDSNDDDDDEYALLNAHIKDIMPAKSNVIIEDLIANCVPAKREPFSLDILKYWHGKRRDMTVTNDLTKVAFTFPASQYMLIHLKENFSISHNDSDKIDKFLIKHNQHILDENLDLLFQDLI